MLTETWHSNFDDTIGAEVVADICKRMYAEEILIAQLKDPSVLTLVAEADGAILGHAMGLADEATIQVNRLYVHPEAQRSGLGTKLFRSLLNGLPERRLIQLEVVRDNPKARAFYAGQGFEVVGEMNECLGATNVPSLKMSKRVGV